MMGKNHRREREPRGVKGARCLVLEPKNLPAMQGKTSETVRWIRVGREARANPAGSAKFEQWLLRLCRSIASSVLTDDFMDKNCQVLMLHWTWDGRSSIWWLING